MKKHTNIGFSGRDSSNYLISTYGSKAGLFEGNLFWIGWCDTLTFILEEELIQY